MMMGARLLLSSSAGAPGTDRVLLETGDALLLETGSDVLLNTSIPAQSAAGVIDGSEYLAIVQGGVTVKIDMATLKEFLTNG